MVPTTPRVASRPPAAERPFSPRVLAALDGAPRARFLLVLFLVAFALRFGAAAALRDLGAGPGSEMGADSHDYCEIARQVASGNGFAWATGEPTSFRPPGLPLVLAGVYWAVGEVHALPYLLFALLGALGCVLVVALVEELAAPRTARWAGVLACLYLPHVYFATLYVTENLLVPLLAGAMLLLLRHLRAPRARTLALASLLLGLSALTRPFGLLLLPLGVVAAVAARRTARRPARPPWAGVLGHALAAALPGLLVVGAWTGRNHAVHGELVLVATNGGSTFYGGNNDRVLEEPLDRGGWVRMQELPGRERVEATVGEVARDRVEWELGLAWVRGHLADLPELVAYKVVRFWLPPLDAPNRLFALLSTVAYVPYLVLLAIGAWRTLVRRELRTPSWLIVHAVVLATLACAIVFWGSPRFRDGSMPALMAYVAVGLEGVRWRRAARPDRSGAPAARRAGTAAERSRAVARGG